MDEHQIEVESLIDAKKEPIVADQAVTLALQARRILAARGKKIVSFTLSGGELQGDTTVDDLRKVIIGPSGNLRAPTLWIGKTMCVGFHPDMYAQAMH
jgi:hypothetical protein